LEGDVLSSARPALTAALPVGVVSAGAHADPPINIKPRIGSKNLRMTNLME
jgi:hypothetical protein